MTRLKNNNHDSQIKLKEILQDDIKAKWDELVLPSGLRENLDRSIVWPVENLGSPRDFGFILFGPPGTGKTTVPYAIGRRLGWKLFYISPKDFVTKDASPEFAIKKIFEKIEMQYIKIKNQRKEDKKNKIDKKYHANIVFVFDEIDELVVSRGSEQDRQTRLLTTMMLPLFNDLREDAEDCGFIFFALTNHIRRFDPAIKRKGRFDLILPLGLPDRPARYRVFEKTIKKLKHEYFGQGVDVRYEHLTIGTSQEIIAPKTSTIDLDVISRASAGLGFGDISSVCKRVIENRLMEQSEGFKEFLARWKRNKKTPKITIYIKTNHFLEWINKHRNSTKDNQEEIDRFYEDSVIYSRGSALNTELNQIGERTVREFDSIDIKDNLDEFEKWKVGDRKTIEYELRNLTELNSFNIDEDIEIVVNGAGFKDHRITDTTRRYIEAGESRRFPPFQLKPKRTGQLKINYYVQGHFTMVGIDTTVDNSSELKGIIRRTSTIEIK